MDEAIQRKALVLVYGDSLVLPRAQDGIQPQDTFAEIFCRCHARVEPAVLYNRGDAGKTIHDHWFRYEHDAGLFAPCSRDTLILFAGMVDCAPRPIPPRLRRKLERQPAFIREPVVWFLRRNRAALLRRGFSFRKVEPEVFKSRLGQWLRDAKERFGRVAVFEIPPVNTVAEEGSPGFQETIVRFNRVIADAVAEIGDPKASVIPLHREVWLRRENLDAYISAVDGHHLLKPGHELAARLLENLLPPL